MWVTIGQRQAMENNKQLLDLIVNAIDEHMVNNGFTPVKNCYQTNEDSYIVNYKFKDKFVNIEITGLEMMQNLADTMKNAPEFWRGFVYSRCELAIKKIFDEKMS